MDKIINKRFDEVFDLSLGRTPSRGVDSYWNGTHTWVSIADMSCGKYISESKECITDKALVETNIPIVKKGTVIMSFKLSIGRVCIADTDLYTNEAIMAFVPKPQYKILSEYLYYYLMCYRWNNSNEVVLGFTLNKKTISQSIVSIPPLAEQKRIVEILDREFEKIDALKANAERSLQQAKDLFQSALKQELQPKEGWETKRLSDICVITSSKRIFKSEYVAEGIPFYRTKEVKEIANNLPISVELYISNEKYSEIKNKFGVPQINDLLVSAVGTIGEIMVVTDDKPFYFKDGNLVWLKGIQGVHSWYLKYYLKSIIDDIKNMTRGAAYNALTIEKFQTMDICFSSMAEQKQIVMRLDKLSTLCKALEENYTKTMALCDDMKQALLRQAFNGEL